MRVHSHKHERWRGRGYSTLLCPSLFSLSTRRLLRTKAVIENWFTRSRLSVGWAKMRGKVSERAREANLEVEQKERGRESEREGVYYIHVYTLPRKTKVACYIYIRARARATGHRRCRRASRLYTQSREEKSITPERKRMPNNGLSCFSLLLCHSSHYLPRGRGKSFVARMNLPKARRARCVFYSSFFQPPLLMLFSFIDSRRRDFIA